MKKSKKPFEWNKVTPLSKYLAMALFVVLPFIGFILGIRYGQVTSLNGYKVEIIKPSDKATVKTYTNSKYKYQLEYPSSWIVQREAKEFGESTLISVPNFMNQFSEEGAVLITVTNIGNQSIDNYMNQRNPTTGNIYKQDYKYRRNITIDSKNGIVTYGGCCGLVGHVVFVKNGNYLYQIQMPESADWGKNSLEKNSIFSKILSSIKFSK